MCTSVKGREDFLSVPADDMKTVQGETHPRISTQVGVYDQPYDDPAKKINNTYEMFLMGIKESPSGNFIGWRSLEGAKEYKFHTYPQVKEMVVTLGTALASMGLKKGDTVGIFSANCPNVTIVDVACSSQGLVIVPLYDSLAPGAVKYIINHAAVKVAFVQDSKISKVVEVMDSCPSLTQVVAMGNKDLKTLEEYEKHSKVMTMAELYATGVNDDTKVSPGSLEDLAMIMYTSGTTGNPKGVVLPNSAFVAGVAASTRFLGQFGGRMCPTDRMLSFLPLAHIFAQTVEKSMMLGGATIGCWQGDVRQLLDDMTCLSPTLFFAVPRIYARFEQKIRETLETSSFIKRVLFNFAYNVQLGRLHNFQARNEFLDKLVFSKIRAKLLPDVRFCVTGAAPMSEDTNDFLKVVLCAPVVQGYGLTETCSVTCCSPPHKLHEPEISAAGNVGGPMNGYVKLVDVPEMNYLSTDKPYPRGEITVKGGMVFSGYYNNEEATREVLTTDGWFSTGDVGQLLPDGSFQIIDRKKNLFKLAHGEYVSPEHLEGEYAKCKQVGQIWVYGNSTEATLVAIIVPDRDQALAWAKQHRKDQTLEAVTADPAFRTEVMHELNHKREQSGFRKFENISDFRFFLELNDLGVAFTVENDLMTPTFKLKRNKLRERFQTQIDEMYAAQKNK